NDIPTSQPRSQNEILVRVYYPNDTVERIRVQRRQHCLNAVAAVSNDDRAAIVNKPLHQSLVVGAFEYEKHSGMLLPPHANVVRNDGGRQANHQLAAGPASFTVRSQRSLMICGEWVATIASNSDTSAA